MRLVSKMKVFEVHEKISIEELQKSVDFEVGDSIVRVTGLQKWNKYKYRWEYDIFEHR